MRGACGFQAELVVSPRREHHFRLGGCAGRPRVPEGGSGGLPELMLGSPKGILQLPGAHSGVSEGHLGASESVLLSYIQQCKLF